MFGIIFIYFFYLSYNTPLTGDDWTWGTDRGITRLQNYFSGYNGRYLSNLLEIVLTRSDILRYLTMATFSAFLVYLLGKITTERNNITYFLLSFILLLVMPVSIYSQTFAWTAGFVNYVISLVLLLMYLVITKNIYNKQMPTYPKWLWCLMVPLGITTQLLVEHVTLFAIFSGIYVISYTYIKHKKILLVHVTYFISLVIGSLIMFTNRAYINVIMGTDSYRTIKEGTSENVGLLKRIYNSYSGDMYQYLFIDSSMINIFIGIMITILVLYHTSRSKWVSFFIKPIIIFILTTSILYLSFLKNNLSESYLGDLTNDFEALLSLGFFFTVLISVFLFIRNIDKMIRLLFYISGVVLLTAPFVFITPYGPRAALASYVFLVLISLELFSINYNLLNWSNKNLVIIFASTATVLVLFYTTIFTMIGVTDRERMNYLESEVSFGAQTIHLTELPHSQFLWMSSTSREHFLEMFKKYYNVPEEIEVQFVPYEY